MAVGDKLVTLDGLKAVYQDVNGNIVDLTSAVTETTRNLFDKYNPNSIGATFASVSGGYKITENGNNKMIIFPVTPGKTYTVSKVSSGRFRYGTFTALPAVGATMIQIQTNQDSLTAKTITMGANENYLAVLYYNSTVDTLTPEQILATLQVEEGSSATPYIAHMTSVDVTARNSAQTANSGIANIDAYIEEFTEPTWNLFDWQHPNIIEGNIASSSDNYIITTGTYKMFWLELEGNKWYMVQKKSSERFRYGLSATQPTISTVFTEVSVANDDVTSKIMYVPSTSKYLTVMYYSANDTLSEETILKSIMVTEGQTKPDYVPYLSAVDQYARRTIKNAGSGNLFAMFDNLTCIGDSLTYGEVFTGESAHRQANRTYPDVLAALSGNTAENLGAMGDSASDWWGHHGTDLIVKTNQLFIVYLGSNGGLTDTIDTDCQGTDIADYEPTNTGCYGKILQTAINVGARAVLVHIYGGGGDVGVDGTNAVIDKFGAKYGFPVLDNEKLTDDAYHYWPSRAGTNSLHYNDLGYAAFAGQLISAINALDPDEAVKLLAVE